MSLMNLEQRLKVHVIGQDEAVEQVSRALRRAKTDTRNQDRPLASFLFDGASGVGKTKLAQAIAIEFYGSKRRLVRVDMGGLMMEKHFLSLFTGSNIDRNPRKVILFCEIDKATPAIAKSLLQIIDDGECEFPEQHVGVKRSLSRPTPLKVDFRNAIIIMTSNIGQPLVTQCLRILTDSELKQRISQKLTGIFRAQLLYRIDEMVLLKNLRKEDLMMMVDVMVEKMKSKSIELKVTDEVKNRVILISIGYSKQLKWAFGRLVEDPLADWFLEEPGYCGCSVTVDSESLVICPAASTSVRILTKEFGWALVKRVVWHV